MKLSLLLCIPAFAVSATDDYNFMQHGVSVGSREAIKEGLRVIKEEIDQIPSTGKSRQMAIEALMKSVSEADKIDSEEVQVLNDIDALLAEILEVMENETVIDQAALDAITQEVADCNAGSNDVISDTNSEATWDQKKLDHESCRTNETSDYNFAEQECSKLVAEMVSYDHSPDVCILPSHEIEIPFPPNYFTLWLDFISNGQDHYQGLIDDMTPLNTECVNAMNTHKDQRDLCEQHQGFAENAFCLWKNARSLVCSNRNTCYTDKVQAHNTLVANTKPEADLRVQEARLIEHVRCLLKELAVNGTTDVDVCKGITNTREQYFQDTYNVTYPDVPAQQACDQTMFDVLPTAGDDAWHAIYMADYVAGGSSHGTAPIHETVNPC